MPIDPNMVGGNYFDFGQAAQQPQGPVAQQQIAPGSFADYWNQSPTWLNILAMMAAPREYLEGYGQFKQSTPQRQIHQEQVNMLQQFDAYKEAFATIPIDDIGKIDVFKHIVKYNRENKKGWNTQYMREFANSIEEPYRILGKDVFKYDDGITTKYFVFKPDKGGSTASAVPVWGHPSPNSPAAMGKAFNSWINEIKKAQQAGDTQKAEFLNAIMVKQMRDAKGEMEQGMFDRVMLTMAADIQTKLANGTLDQKEVDNNPFLSSVQRQGNRIIETHKKAKQMTDAEMQAINKEYSEAIALAENQEQIDAINKLYVEETGMQPPKLQTPQTPQTQQSQITPPQFSIPTVQDLVKPLVR